MSVFSSPSNALLIESCYTNAHKVIKDESLLSARERRTSMKVLLLQKANLLPLFLSTRNSIASAWTEPSYLFHLERLHWPAERRIAT
jgi:hypothetical protein